VALRLKRKIGRGVETGRSSCKKVIGEGERDVALRKEVRA
jgi:hypothetical protein